MDKLSTHLPYDEHDLMKGNTCFVTCDTVVVPSDWPFIPQSWLRAYAGNVVKVLEIDPDNAHLVFAKSGETLGWLYSTLLGSILSNCLLQSRHRAYEIASVVDGTVPVRRDFGIARAPSGVVFGQVLKIWRRFGKVLAPSHHVGSSMGGHPHAWVKFVNLGWTL